MSGGDLLDRALFLAVYEAFVEATAPLIGELAASGVSHPPDIARALNARGIPCFGRRRWTGSLVRAVLDQATRRVLSDAPRHRKQSRVGAQQRTSHASPMAAVGDDLIGFIAIASLSAMIAAATLLLAFP